MMGIMTSGNPGAVCQLGRSADDWCAADGFPAGSSCSTFWLLMAAGVVLITTVFLGGFQTGWTGYQPLRRSEHRRLRRLQSPAFSDRSGCSITPLGLTFAATIITMRAPGMTWSRLPNIGLKRPAPPPQPGCSWACAASMLIAAAPAPLPLDRTGADCFLRCLARAAVLTVRKPVGCSATRQANIARAARIRPPRSSCFRSSRASRCGATGWPVAACSGA